MSTTKPRNCSTCTHAGFDGDYGTLPTCDATASDSAEKAVYAWIDGGKQGDCPSHDLHWIEKPGELDAFIAHCEELERKHDDPTELQP